MKLLEINKEWIALYATDSQESLNDLLTNHKLVDVKPPTLSYGDYYDRILPNFYYAITTRFNDDKQLLEKFKSRLKEFIYDIISSEKKSHGSLIPRLIFYIKNVINNKSPRSDSKFENLVYRLLDDKKFITTIINNIVKKFDEIDEYAPFDELLELIGYGVREKIITKEQYVSLLKHSRNLLKEMISFRKIYYDQYLKKNSPKRLENIVAAYMNNTTDKKNLIKELELTFSELVRRWFFRNVKMNQQLKTFLIDTLVDVTVESYVNNLEQNI